MLAKRILAACTLTLGLTAASLTAAADFSSADALFRQRAESYEKATQAHDAYEAMLASLQGEDLIYAVSQMARLDIYRGGMNQGVANADKKAAFDHCMRDTAKIKSTGRQEYYYFYLACMGFRGKLGTDLERLNYGVKLRRIQPAALDASRNSSGQLLGGFEGGGILRVLSAVRANPMAKPLGLYDPQEALDFVKLALQSPERSYKPFPNPMRGEDFYENYFYEAQAKVSLGIKDGDDQPVRAASRLLDATISRLDDLEAIDELPAGREPETMFYKQLMRQLRADIDQCLQANDWVPCLTSKIR